MVGVDARGHVGVEVFAGKPRRVAVDLLVVRLGGGDFLQHLAVAGHGAHVVHHLRKTPHSWVLVEGVDGAVIEHRAGFIQRRCRYTAWQHEPHVHREVFRGLEHEVDAVNAHDVGNLMGIGDHGGGAVGQERPAQLRRRDQGALQVDVAVHKARQDDPAGHVVFHVALVASHAHDEPVGHGDVALENLIGKDIEIARVL